MQKDRSYKDEIHRAFRRSESQLRKALKRRKAEVKVKYTPPYTPSCVMLLCLYSVTVSTTAGCFDVTI